MRVTHLHKSGTVRAEFSGLEAELLAGLCAQLIEMLTAYDATDAGDTVDPAMARMLPDAYRDDPEASAEFRHYTESGLLARKVLNAQSVMAALAVDEAEPGEGAGLGDASDLGLTDPDAVGGSPSTHPDPEYDAASAFMASLPSSRSVELDEPAALSWLRTITDLRLTLAVRLRIETDDDLGRQDADGIRMREVYDWLAFVQESLIRAL